MSHVHPREAARSVHSAPVNSGIGAQCLSLSAWRSTDCRPGHLCQHGPDRSIEGAGAGSTRLPNPRRFDEQNPVVARAVRGYFCVFN